VSCAKPAEAIEMPFAGKEADSRGSKESVLDGVQKGTFQGTRVGPL